jgi:DnaJ-class molecular chaperone
MCHYDTLCINRDATPDEIKKAYRRLALLHHPDKNNGDDTLFKKINESYQILSNPETRKQYDKQYDNKANSILNLLKMFLNMFKEKQSATDVRITVIIEDVYYGRLKKLQLKIKNNDIIETKSFIISLVNFQQKYTFPKEGDNGGDLNIYVDVLPHKSGIKIDQTLYMYDLYYEKKITLYEYYYGIEFKLEHVNSDILIIKKTFEKTMCSIIDNKGILKDDGSHGHLYIFYELIHKPHSEIDLINPRVEEFLRIL